MSVSSVTSEALQLKLRQLLPSQQGFGTDISASDTIIPIIDLTASAEGSDTRLDLQTALNFGGATVFDVSNSTTTLANSSGFYKVTGTFHQNFINAANTLNISITNGLATKIMYGMGTSAATTQDTATVTFDLVFFLAVGETLTVNSTSTDGRAIGSSRQIATSNGTLVQPTGFTPQ